MASVKDLSQDLDIFVSNKKDDILEFGFVSFVELSPFRVLLLQLLLLQVVVFFFLAF